MWVIVAQQYIFSLYEETFSIVSIMVVYKPFV